MKNKPTTKTHPTSPAPILLSSTHNRPQTRQTIEVKSRGGPKKKGGKKVKDKQTKREPQLSHSMVEDKATEKLKKRLQDLGLIVNAGKAAKPTGKKKRSQR